MKRAPESYQIDRIGVYAVGKIVHSELHWDFREKDGDFGIDAHIEVFADGVPTGKIIAVQIKSGPSYFTDENDAGIVFRGTLTHLDYWLNHDLPVIVVLYDPGIDTAFWESVTPQHVTRTPKGWKMVVPRGQKLEAAQANKLEELASILQRLKDEIREYQCPHCGALLTERGGDCDHYYEAFQCGYVNTDGCGKSPCPWDPKFPRFEDYELQFVSTKTDAETSWVCIANPKTDMARWISLVAYGRTKEEAEQRIRAEYERKARKEKK